MRLRRDWPGRGGSAQGDQPRQRDTVAFQPPWRRGKGRGPGVHRAGNLTRSPPPAEPRSTSRGFRMSRPVLDVAAPDPAELTRPDRAVGASSAGDAARLADGEVPCYVTRWRSRSCPEVTVVGDCSCRLCTTVCRCARRFMNGTRVRPRGESGRRTAPFLRYGERRDGRRRRWRLPGVRGTDARACAGPARRRRGRCR